jgi:F0F1-type ATP synthase membrane subunit b/b'
MSDNNIPDKNQILFMQLLMNFQNAAWQALGKIKNPFTDKIERDLDQARYAIDMLEMLRQKTGNNVSENEKRYMDSLIRDLQLNYVDEVNKKEPESEEKSGKAEEAKEEEKAGKPDPAPAKEKKTAGRKKSPPKKKPAGKSKKA